jgi:hypothetical protein
MPSRWYRIRGSKIRTISIMLLLAALVGASIGQAQAPPAQQAAPATDPLLALNQAFRADYLRTKEAAIAHSGPLIVVQGGNVALRRGGTRQEAPYTPAIYHVLKEVAHVPLALDVILASHASEDTLDEATLNGLREYGRLIAVAEPSLASYGMESESIDRSRKIFADCRAFLDSVVQARRCSNDERIKFARRMTPMVMKNVGEAARAELDSLHRQVSSWLSEMTAEERKSFKVVILGAALPRKQNLALQYFARLLHEPGEGSRIIYAESMHDEAMALDLMATGIVDTTIGADFFNDPTRMHRDLLADAARDYLPLLIDRP